MIGTAQGTEASTVTLILSFFASTISSSKALLATAPSIIAVLLPVITILGGITLHSLPRHAKLMSCSKNPDSSKERKISHAKYLKGLLAGKPCSMVLIISFSSLTAPALA